MMSAPSCASRIACERPCPRAAPVTKATLPSSWPMALSCWLEVRERDVAGDGVEADLDRHPGPDVLRVAADDAGHDPGALGEFDDRDDIGDAARQRGVGR